MFADCLAMGIQQSVDKQTSCTVARRFSGNSGSRRLACGLSRQQSMTMERALGWWLACAVHPHAGWRVMRPSGRAVLVGTYFAAGYLAALTVLLAR